MAQDCARSQHIRTPGWGGIRKMSGGGAAADGWPAVWRPEAGSGGGARGGEAGACGGRGGLWADAAAAADAAGGGEGGGGGGAGY
jgi:hypothetical protein